MSDITLASKEDARNFAVGQELHFASIDDMQAMRPMRWHQVAWMKLKRWLGRLLWWRNSPRVVAIDEVNGVITIDRDVR